jgi:hypothetical protein
MTRKMCVAGALVLFVMALLGPACGASEPLEFSIVYSNNINGNVVPCRT